MRHRKSGRQLNRNSSHRKAMFRNMACSLLEHQVIKTTLPKAKELRRVIEPLITHAKKNDSVAGRRYAFDRLRSDAAVAALFNDVAPRCQARNGGYLRILKCGFRTGDKAPMAFVELVDRDGAVTEQAEVTSTKSKVNAKPKAEVTTEAVVEAPAENIDSGNENPVATRMADFDADAAKAAMGKKIKPDDLTMIEGIGPKIAEIFTNAGIATWAALAETEVERCKAILADAGDRYKMHDPNTWPRQAKLAAEGQWSELANWQEQLDGGREVE